MSSLSNCDQHCENNFKENKCIKVPFFLTNAYGSSQSQCQKLIEKYHEILYKNIDSLVERKEYLKKFLEHRIKQKNELYINYINNEKEKEYRNDNVNILKIKSEEKMIKTTQLLIQNLTNRINKTGL